MKVENGKLKIMVGKTVCKTQTIVARPFCLYESHCYTVAAVSDRQSHRLQNRCDIAQYLLIIKFRLQNNL